METKIRHDIDVIMRPSVVFRFLTGTQFKCCVLGCRRFARRSILCRHHQGSVKFQRLSQT